MSAVAIDIGTYSIKVISANTAKKPVVFEKVIEVANPVGVSIPADEQTKEKLAQTIQSIFSDNSLVTEDVRLALPESVLSTKVIQVPQLSDAELASAIGWQAEQFIPIPKEELSLEYQVLYRPPAGDKDSPMMVLLVGTRKKVINDLIAVFNFLGIEPTLIETQTIAIWRAIQAPETDPVSLVAHMGFSTLDISIQRAGELAFVFSHAQGGSLLTRSIQNTLALSIQQAEEYKRTYGLDERYFEGKMNQALMPVLSSMLDQIKKAIQFYSSQYPQEAVERVYLSGGSALLPGLVPYSAAVLGKEVLIINPFLYLPGAPEVINQSAYSVCAGLLLRDE